MGIWQKRLCSLSRWWSTQICVNPTQVSDQMNHPVFPRIPLFQEEKGVFLVDEAMPWNMSLKLWTMFISQLSSNYDYWVKNCKHFYANKTVIDWIQSQHFDVAVVDLIQGGPLG